MKFEAGNVAFITGGASGAGLGQARVFGAKGMRVAIADVRPDAVEAATESLRAEGINALGVVLDITDRAAYAEAADRVEAHFGAPVALLSNTAGVNGFGPLAEATYADFDWVLGVNLGGVINGMQTFVPRMQQAGRGHIVSVASMAGFQGSPAAGIYAAAKAAVINLSESYRLSLAKDNIGVSLVCPASIRTDIAETLRTRPTELAEGSSFRSDEAFVQLQRELYRGGMEPEELAEHIWSAVAANRFWVLPFAETREGLKAHFDTILAAYDDTPVDPAAAAERARAFEAYRAKAAKAAAAAQAAAAPHAANA